MSSSVLLRRVALVRTDVSIEHVACIIRVTRIRELGKNYFCPYDGSDMIL
jgi:hypothetical protein